MVHMKDKVSQALCPECDIETFTRNHYFTGKLLVEADFTDEQHYHREKMRHHNQRLHGWGVVCGLKVKQFDQPACLNRFVYIEPGTALDCCGHEIVLREQVPFDITQTDAIKGLQKQQDTSAHVLQICLRYKDCPIEEIPVLYDDCGCDDTQCAPNRILESYDLDVRLDALEKPHDMSAPHLHLDSFPISVSTPRAERVALDEQNHRFYIMTETKLYQYQISANTPTVLAIRDLPTGMNGLEMAISNDGSRLYVVVDANPRQLLVLDTTPATFTSQSITPITITGSGTNDVFLAVAPAPDNRLMALLTPTGPLLIWDSSLNGAMPAAPTSVPLPSAGQASGLAIGAAHVYVSDNGNISLFIIDTTTNAVTSLPLTTLSIGGGFGNLAVISSTSTSPELLAFLDIHTLNLINPLATSAAFIGAGPVTINNLPGALAISPGGRWAYVLGQDPHTFSTRYLQSVDLYKIQQGLSVTPSAPIQVGNNAVDLTLSASGRRLYIPYSINLPPQPDDLGTVEIVDIDEQSCTDLLWDGLDGCPYCETPHCIVLATIKDYKLNYALEDPPALTTDDSKQISRIDNRTGRRLLPSTQALTEVLECVLENGTGGTGTQGPPGATGATGATGAMGPAGPGLEQGLVGINALSWVHKLDTLQNAILPITIDGIPKFGIVVSFTKAVNVPIDDGHLFEVLVDTSQDKDSTLGVICRCSVLGTVVPVDLGTFSSSNANLITNAHQAASPPNALGAAFIFNQATLKLISDGGITDVFVRIRGDFILEVPEVGNKARAIDAEFVRAELPTGNRVPNTAGGPYGIQGGLFESWFRTAPPPISDPKININKATAAELQQLPGIGETLAQRIISLRAEKPFASSDDLLNVQGITRATVEAISDRITFN